MTNAEAVDFGSVAIAVVLPWVLIPKWKAKAILPSAAGSWVIMAVTGKLLQDLDPEREATVLDSTWFIFGWISTTAYALFVFLIQKTFFLYFQSKKVSS